MYLTKKFYLTDELCTDVAFNGSEQAIVIDSASCSNKFSTFNVHPGNAVRLAEVNIDASGGKFSILNGSRNESKHAVGVCGPLAHLNCLFNDDNVLSYCMS